LHQGGGIATNSNVLGPTFQEKEANVSSQLRGSGNEGDTTPSMTLEARPCPSSGVLKFLKKEGNVGRLGEANGKFNFVQLEECLVMMWPEGRRSKYTR
jgi:hypothetical protein